MAVEQETLSKVPARRAPAEDGTAPVWLQRISLVVFVVFCFNIGGLLVWLPWFSRSWSQNGWILAHPAVDAIAQQGWFRGLVSGMGLIDIWIGLSELLHYRDYRG